MNILNLKDCVIKEVWKENFEEEIQEIQKIIQNGYCKVISFDTEFPGISIKPIKQNTDSNQEYKTIKENVNNQKMIQFGMTITDEKGDSESCMTLTYQFNIKYELAKEKYDMEGIKLLQQSGIKFEELEEKGIDLVTFAEQIITLDIFFNKDVQWVCFHGNYDLAYMIRTIDNQDLPESLDQFENIMKLYFPTIMDLKFILNDNLYWRKVGLSQLAQELGLNRIGTQHQAGSDSLLTHACYFKLKQQGYDLSSKANKIYGIADGFVTYLDHSYYNNINQNISIPNNNISNININTNINQFQTYTYSNNQTINTNYNQVETYSYQPPQYIEQDLQQYSEYIKIQYTNKMKLKKKMKK